MSSIGVFALIDQYNIQMLMTDWLVTSICLEPHKTGLYISVFVNIYFKIVLKSCTLRLKITEETDLCSSFGKQLNCKNYYQMNIILLIESELLIKIKFESN